MTLEGPTLSALPVYALASQGRPRTEQSAWRTDRWWLFGIAALIAILCGLPYVLSALFGPPDLVRSGTFWFPRDFSQYQAAMREGAGQSGWLIHDHFSAEPHQPVLMYPLYVGAGKLAAALGVESLDVFTGLEWLGRLAVLAAIYSFASTFLSDRRQRRLAVVLALATLGLDAWLLPVRMIMLALGVDWIASSMTGSVNSALEYGSLGVLLSAPHLAFGLSLTLACAPLYLRAISRPRFCPLAWLGLAIVGVSVTNAFNAPVLVCVVTLHALLSGRQAWPAAIVAALAAAPMTIYSLLLYQSDPFWSATYSVQNLTPSPPIWALPNVFGLVLLAAPLAWPVARRWPTDRRWLVVLWIGLGLVWMYAPLPYQRRFAFGVQPALAVLAAVGLLQLNAWLRLRNVGWLARRVVNYGLALAAVSTSLLVYLALILSSVLNRPVEVAEWSRAEVEAATWLGRHTTGGDVILASTEFATPLAGVIDGRVVSGHDVATLNSPAKDALVRAFFAADAASDTRAQALRDSGATIVAVGPHERLLGTTSLDPVAAAIGLETVYDLDGVELYRVR